MPPDRGQRNMVKDTLYGNVINKIRTVGNSTEQTTCYVQQVHCGGSKRDGKVFRWKKGIRNISTNYNGPLWILKEKSDNEGNLNTN